MEMSNAVLIGPDGGKLCAVVAVALAVMVMAKGAAGIDFVRRYAG
jgi:hypothetical protein